MSSRTQIVCLHEGRAGRSIDPLFYRTVVRLLGPSWIRQWDGSNVLRMVDCGGRAQLIQRMPAELHVCLTRRSSTTLIVCADLDHDMPDGDALRAEFWREAQAQGVDRSDFDSIVFAFAKDRIENWIEFLIEGHTDEMREAPRVRQPRMAAEAARILAERCKGQRELPPLPPSLQWSCANWHALADRMRA